LAARSAMTTALDDALALLRCPVCAAGLTRVDPAVVRCARGHAFDVARQGYLSLLTGAGAPTGDSAQMVADRDALLGGGHFDALADAVADAVGPRADRRALAEVGAGTAFYLARALERSGAEVGVALDVSRYALRRAARAHPRVAAIGADVWAGLPLRDGAVDDVLCVFAPRNGPELRRLLADDGRLVVATPTPRHLAEIVAPLGLLGVDARKDERLAERLAGGFELDSRTTCQWPMALDHQSVAALAGMGPSAFHVTREALGERIAALPPTVRVTGSVTISVYAVG
jgi:23S rRNA (guanine745-N1)-methyltransferase